MLDIAFSKFQVESCPKDAGAVHASSLDFGPGVTHLAPDLNQSLGKRQFLTYYMIAAYPGCSEKDMLKLKEFASQSLHIFPEQVQIFTPTPSTYGSVMYYTEMDPFTREKIFVEKDAFKKERQKVILVMKPDGRGG